MRKLNITLFALLLLSWRLNQFQEKKHRECVERSSQHSSHFCLGSRKNPHSLNEQKWGLQRVAKFPNQKRFSGESLKFQKVWIQKLKLRTRESPTLFGFQKAIWTGDLSSLPFWLIQKYRERGLLPVLALSGQHVWALLVCMNLFVLLVWKTFGKARGKLLWRINNWKILLITAWLFSLASQEPSMLRTVISAGIAFCLGKLPLHFERSYVFLFSVLFFLLLFPEQISSRGFILSVWGMLGICVAGSCFSPKQYFLKGIWLWIWLVPLVAGFFGVCLGKGFYFTWILSGVWEQVFLPLLFATGISLMLLPIPLAHWIASKTDSLLNFWLLLEGSDTESYSLLVFRPKPLEIIVFALWLTALAYWNRRTWLNS